jgi:hypothetical protein
VVTFLFRTIGLRRLASFGPAWGVGVCERLSASRHFGKGVGMAKKEAVTTPEDATFGLDEVLHALGRDLLRAEEQAKQQAFGLYVKDAEVELSFTVEKSSKGGGGLNLKVFGVGFSGEGEQLRDSVSVHRIRLSLVTDDEERRGDATSASRKASKVAAKPRRPAGRRPVAR